MKRISTILVLFFLALPFLSKAQYFGYGKSYGYAYAYNTETKTVYISNCVQINADKYNKCEEAYSDVLTCFKVDFVNSLKAEVGSKSRDFKLEVVYKDKNLVNFGNTDEVNLKIKSEIAFYSDKDYTVYKISL